MGGAWWKTLCDQVMALHSIRILALIASNPVIVLVVRETIHFACSVTTDSRFQRSHFWCAANPLL